MRLLKLVLLCAAIISSHAGQIPMRPTLGMITGSESWEFGSKFSENSTSHLIFNTVSSLLQHWPNTRYRNGHTLVPGSIPPGTLLYYGTSHPELPTGPDWTATDPEHSYMFCRGKLESGCWHLTLVTTRPLKVLYFDGTSAAKMDYGPMDSQDVLLWGEVRPDRIGWEWERIKQLCEWGKEYGVDGYVRMEMDFEIMLCDFNAGLETVSFLNLISQRISANFTLIDTLNQFPTQWINVIESGSLHNRYPGENRIQLDLAHLVSFYDTSLAPSLVPHRYGKDRILHRLKGLNRMDSAAIGRRLREAFSSRGERSSGVDWATLLQVIIKRYADRLEMVQHLLDTTSPASQQSRLEQARRVQYYLWTVITPYILHPSLPTDSDDKTSISWAIPIYKHCATTHIAYIASNKDLHSKMTQSEHLIYEAVRDTNREICRVIVRIWAEGVMRGLDPAPNILAATVVDDNELEEALKRWKNEIESLMEWLDWSVWLKCKPACSFEELCYLPTWPFLKAGNFSASGGPPTSPDIPRWPDTEDESTWIDPKPRCIRRIQSYHL